MTTHKAEPHKALQHLSCTGPARQKEVVLLVAVSPDLTAPAAAVKPGSWDSLIHVHASRMLASPEHCAWLRLLANMNGKQLYVYTCMWCVPVLALPSRASATESACIRTLMRTCSWSYRDCSTTQACSQQTSLMYKLVW